MLRVDHAFGGNNCLQAAFGRPFLFPDKYYLFARILFLFRRQPTKPNAEQEGKNYGKSDPDISAQIMRVLGKISLGISVELVRVLNPIDPEKYRRT